MTSFLSETQASVDVLQNVVFSIHPLNAFEDEEGDSTRNSHNLIEDKCKEVEMLLQQWQGTAKELTTLIGPEIPKIVGLVACLLQHTHKTRTKAAEDLLVFLAKTTSSNQVNSVDEAFVPLLQHYYIKALLFLQEQTCRGDEYLAAVACSFRSLACCLQREMTSKEMNVTVNTLVMVLRDYRVSVRRCAFDVIQHLLSAPSNVGLLKEHSQMLFELLRLAFSSDKVVLLDACIPVTLEMLQTLVPSKAEIEWHKVIDTFVHQFDRASVPIEVRKVVLRHAVEFFSIVSFQLIPHLPEIVTSLVQYLYWTDAEILLGCLACLKVVVVSCWPRIGRYYDEILQAIKHVESFEYPFDTQLLESRTFELRTILVHCKKHAIK